MIPMNKCYTIINVFCLVFEAKQFSLLILLFRLLNQQDPLCINVLLSTVLTAQDAY